MIECIIIHSVMVKMQFLNNFCRHFHFYAFSIWQSASVMIHCQVMAALWNRAGHYVFVLWFLLLASFFFSSPNLSRHTLDVYHTSTRDVALVQIQNAGLKCAACGSLGIQDAKLRHLGTIAKLCRAISLQLGHVSTIGESMLSSNISSTCPHNMVSE